MEQVVVPPAGEHAAGQPRQVAAEDQAAVVAHVVDDGEVQPEMGSPAHGGHEAAEVLQLPDRRLCGLALDQARQPGQYLLRGPIEQGQGFQPVRCLPGKTPPGADIPDGGGVLPPQLLQKGVGDFLGNTLQQPGGHAHVADIQQMVAADEGQALIGQGQDLACGVGVQVPDALQTCLHDLPVSRGGGGGAVNGFVVADLLRGPRRIRAVFHDGQRYIRL